MILRDSIENTEEYKEAMEEIQPILDREFPEDMLEIGLCHRIWARKKELLLHYGIVWKTPAELNADTIFD